MEIEEHKPLAPLTTLGVGGSARWFAQATTEDEVAAAAAWVRAHNVPLFVLGGGSNLLVSDTGFGGLVLHMRLPGIDLDAPSGRVSAAAGEDWDRCVQRAVEANLAGIECLAGIPGSVGGTPVQNVGAYGQEVDSVIQQVRAFDTVEARFVEIPAAACGFSYRRSRFNTVDRGRFIVTRVHYRLTPGGTPALHYADLQRAFPAGAHPSLVEVAEAVRRIRSAKGMLLVENDPDCRSAGSFFKNPVVALEQAQAIAAAAGKQPPQYPAGTGQVKLSAAWLIEQAGFTKGFACGAAGLSSKHTLALVNRGGAHAADLLVLARQIRGTVDQRFGVMLEMEPVLLGEFSS